MSKVFVGVFYISIVAVLFLIIGFLFQLTWNHGFFEAGLVDREIGFWASFCILTATTLLGSAWNSSLLSRKRE